MSLPLFLPSFFYYLYVRFSLSLLVGAASAFTQSSMPTRLLTIRLGRWAQHYLRSIQDVAEGKEQIDAREYKNYDHTPKDT